MNSVREELEYITRQNGGYCSPFNVVEFAKNPDTFLHSKFIWDNNQAAELYRLEQARKLLRLELVVIGNSENKESVNLFYSLKDDRSHDKGYRLITDILKDKDLTNQLIAEALRELTIFQRKYNSLISLKSIFKAINELKNELVSIESET